jgi:midasin
VDMVYLQRMRTVEDRMQVTKLFKEVFGEELIVQLKPYHQISPVQIQVGHSSLARSDLGIQNSITLNLLWEIAHYNEASPSLQILQWMLNPLENIMKCVEMNWLSIVLGHSAVGKTSLIRLLANITGNHSNLKPSWSHIHIGNKLHEFSMNTGVDTTELLGGYEQVDLNREKSHLFDNIRKLLQKLTRSCLLGNSTNALPQLRRLHDLFDMLITRNLFEESSKINMQENIEQLYEQTKTLIGNIKDTCDYLKIATEDGSSTSISHLLYSLERFKHLSANNARGCFEWVDGLLIKVVVILWQILTLDQGIGRRKLAFDG